MAENLSSRTRLLSLVEILTMHSDELNVMSIEEICEKLSEYGYEVTKRTVVADIKAVNTTPIKIIQVNKPKKGYYIAENFLQPALNMVLEAVFSSPLLSEENCDNVVDFLRRKTCIDTLELILETTEHFRTAIPQRKSCINSLYTIRVAIKEKKQVDITFAKTVPGDSFSEAEFHEKIRVNPVKITVCNSISALIFTRPETPDKPEYISLPRIKHADITDIQSETYSGSLISAVNMFTGEKFFCNHHESEWILIRFRSEDAEFIRNCFSVPVYFRKSKHEGYCKAKVLTFIDNNLIGLLFKYSDKIEIVKPDSLRDFFNSKINNK